MWWGKRKIIKLIHFKVDGTGWLDDMENLMTTFECLLYHILSSILKLCKTIFPMTKQHSFAVSNEPLVIKIIDRTKTDSFQTAIKM